MPSPIGHTLAGLAVAELFDGRPRPAVFWANAPDVDLLIGVLKKHPGAWHGHQTHSLGATVLAGAVAGAYARSRGRQFVPGFWQGAAAYGSHLLLDYLGKQTGDGMPLLWPLSDRRFASPDPWFGTIISKSAERGFFRGLFTRKNVRAVAREMASLLPVLGGCVALSNGGRASGTK